MPVAPFCPDDPPEFAGELAAVFCVLEFFEADFVLVLILGELLFCPFISVSSKFELLLPIVAISLLEYLLSLSAENFCAQAKEKVESISPAIITQEIVKFLIFRPYFVTINFIIPHKLALN